jgi:hypothetical protein
VDGTGSGSCPVVDFGIMGLNLVLWYQKLCKMVGQKQVNYSNIFTGKILTDVL